MSFYVPLICVLNSLTDMVLPMDFYIMVFLKCKVEFIQVLEHNRNGNLT